MTIKEKLQYFIDNGFSITYISNRMSVDPSTLSKWLKGQKGITHKNEDKVLLTLQTLISEMNKILEE